jgi:hypothetical protein
MTRPENAESKVNSKGTSTTYLGAAIAVTAFSVLTFGNASEWFDYVSGAVFLCLAGTLGYQGIQSIAQRRRSADKQSHR